MRSTIIRLNETGMAEVSIIEIDYNNEMHVADFLEVMDAYAQDPYGLNDTLDREVLRLISEELKQIPYAISFLAYTGGTAVGIANCYVLFSTLHAGRLINIHDLFVLKEKRNGGIGKKLLQAVQEKAEELNCGSLTLEVRKDNIDAVRLYERFGFDDDYQMWFLVKSLSG